MAVMVSVGVNKEVIGGKQIGSYVYKALHFALLLDFQICFTHFTKDNKTDFLLAP